VAFFFLSLLLESKDGQAGTYAYGKPKVGHVWHMADCISCWDDPWLTTLNGS
jgi:hypothetical protein